MSTRIEFNSQGFREILLSEGCRDLVIEATDEIAIKANNNNERGGEGFNASVQVGGYGGGRWVGFVHSTDAEAYKAEAEDKVLTRAVTQ